MAIPRIWLRACRSKHPVATLLLKYAPILTSVAIFSGVINFLALAGSFYMLQVYDRVLPSQSVPTLIGLSVLMVGLYAINGMLEYLRSRIMSRIGTRIDKNLSPKVFHAVQILPLRSAVGGDGMQPSAISTPSARSWAASACRRFSICRGCRSICSSSICSTLAGPDRRCSAPSRSSS